jgi:hypothetical protein
VCVCLGITVESLKRFRPNLVHILLYVCVRVRVRVTFRLTVSQSIRLGVKPILGLLTRNLSLSGVFIEN